MAISNKTLLQKADMQVSDLMSDGGYLAAEQAQKFIKDVINEAVVLKMIDVRAIKSHTANIDKVGISGRVLKPANSGQALAEADRSKPTTSQEVLTTNLMKGEIDLPYEVVEDNIEAGTFKSTIKQLMAESISYDLDDFVVNGDDSGTTGTILDLQDGLLAGATSHTVDGAVATISNAMFTKAVKAMPKRFNRFKSKQRILTSLDAETDYRDVISQRATNLGDKFLLDEVPVSSHGRPMIPVPSFPDNLSGTSNCTNALLMDPKVARFGIWRSILFESDKDIREGVWIMVASIRAGVKYREEDAVVKVYDIKTQ